MSGTPSGCVPQIEQFNFNEPDKWPKWKRRFERYLTAAGLGNKTDEEKVNTLIYLMGDAADDILLTFNLSAADQTKFNLILEKFDGHFIPKKNIVYERTKFNQCVQSPGENFEDFLINLYTLVETCDYGILKEEMVRDRIVSGVSDGDLSEKLQLVDGLTLSKAIQICKQYEEVKKHKSLFSSSSVGKVGTHYNKFTDKPVNKINRSQPGTSRGYSSRNNNQNQQPPKRNKECPWCGIPETHPRERCPARDATCYFCRGRGHYSRVCKSRARGKVGAVDNSDDDSNNSDLDHGVLGAVGQSKDLDNKWQVSVEMEGEYISFRLDTGADVTVVPSTYAKKKFLEPTNKKLYGPNHQRLDVVGKLRVKLKYHNRESVEDIYYVRDLSYPLLGRPAIENLKMIKLVLNIQNTSLIEDIIKEYPSLFKGLGTIPGVYKIDVKEDAVPYCLTTPRSVPIPLLSSLKEELLTLEKKGIINRIEEPSEWCSPIVIVPKKVTSKDTPKIRLCIDFTKVNASIKRQHHPIPKVESTLAMISGAKYFSKLDANSGFYQIQIAPESKHLTTFITPFGRYTFNRLPFGITSAPEIFQRKMEEILNGEEGAICRMDDILVWGRTLSEHNHRLRQVLNKLKNSGMTLNKSKCVVGVESIHFLGHKIDGTGIRPDDDKIKAISDMPEPTDKKGVQRFLGMINFVCRSIPNRASILEPLYALLKDNTMFFWGPDQKRSFSEIKKVLIQSPALAVFDPSLETIVSADASSYGIGGALFQKQPDGQVRPVAYVSRTLNEAERRYAQIEREGLAVAWTMTKLEEYILGLPNVTLQTDHKPLVPIFSTKTLDSLSPRLLRFKIRLARYSYNIVHVPGKDLLIADTLSRQPIEPSADEERFPDAEEYINLLFSSYQASDARLQEILNEQQADDDFQVLVKYILEGWPVREEVDSQVVQYWPERNNLSLVNGFLMNGNRLLIPKGLHKEILNRLHDGHQGITKTRRRAQDTVWWPGISKQIEELVKSCQKCIEHAPPPRNEPLQPSIFPERPWQRIAADLLYYKGKIALSVIDYYSGFLEVEFIPDMKMNTVIGKLRAIFARHGIPEELRTDCGSHFKLDSFAKEYGFNHVMSSPRFPQSNGEAEAGVKIVKRILSKSDNFYRGLLAYNSTPRHNGYSPSELLMNRKLRTTLPMHPGKLDSCVPDKENLRNKEFIHKANQKYYYNRRHGTRELKPLSVSSKVWIQDLNRYGKVVSSDANLRTYKIDTGNQILRRNRWALTPVPKELDNDRNIRGQPIEDVEGNRPASSTPPSDDIVRSPSSQVVASPRQQLTLLKTPVGRQATPETTHLVDKTPNKVSRYGREIRKPKRLDW